MRCIPDLRLAYRSLPDGPLALDLINERHHQYGHSECLRLGCEPQGCHGAARAAPTARVGERSASESWMNIACVSYYLPPVDMIGSGMQMHYLANAYARDGHHVVMFSPYAQTSADALYSCVQVPVGER